MGDLGEFSFTVRAFLKTYRWRRIDPVPWSPLRRPLSDCRLALVTTAGLIAPGQKPFDGSIRGGDTSFRVIDAAVDPATLIDSHRSETFDHHGMVQDKNLALPIDRVHELVAAGRVGSLNRRNLSFMGSITAPGRLIRESAPSAARILVEDGVDAALLVPA
jgi:D-proline reductase (dithiol) PrdB